MGYKLLINGLRLYTVVLSPGFLAFRSLSNNTNSPVVFPQYSPKLSKKHLQFATCSTKQCLLFIHYEINEPD